MNLYIKGTGILSAAGNNSTSDFLQSLPAYDNDRLLCKEPDYKEYIPPMQLRRMSKAVRMGIGASKICLLQSGATTADAISVGTAFGCLQDTEVFLSKMVDQDEQMLTPTAFIQSTHNTVAGQIALNMSCYGHNLTYVHRGHSFEHAMINAALYLNDHTDHHILVGGIEELTDTSVEVLQHMGVYRRTKVEERDWLNDAQLGSLAGEGASFFMVGKNRPQQHDLCIKDIALFTTRDTSVALQKVEDFLHHNDIIVADIDLVLLGINGDSRTDGFYKTLREQTFFNNSQAAFKHLCGEFPVAGSFALGLMVHAATHGLPDVTVLNNAPKRLQRMIIVNNFLHHYSCWLLEMD